jgi:tetratricopeptide (TPR) repeat protein
MTFETKRPSYKERLSNLGALIDDEIDHIVRTQIEEARESFEKNLKNRGSSSNRHPSESEVEEVLLLLQTRSDQSFVLDFLRNNMELMSAFPVLKAADINLRRFILESVPECALKRFFNQCCKEGDAELLNLISVEWMRRLTKSLDETRVEACSVVLVRSRNLKAIERLTELGMEISDCSLEGNNLVQEAIRTGDERIVELILNQVPPDQLGLFLAHKNTLGTSAIETESTERIRQIIQAHWLIALSLEGNACYKEGQYAEAVSRYKEAVAFCESFESDARIENLVKLEYNCGRALFRQGRSMDCIQHCSRCLELDSSYLNAYSQIAQAKMELFDYIGAKKDYETLIGILSGQGKSSDQAIVRQVNELRLKILEIDQIVKTDHYTILGIEQFTNDDSKIKSAYRQLARKFHPDKVMSEGEDVRARSRNQFSRIQTAYEVLTGSGKDEYDLNLRIQIGAESVRQSLLMRRRSCSGSPPTTPSSPSTVIRQMRMRQFLGSEDSHKTPAMSRSFDVLFRN